MRIYNLQLMKNNQSILSHVCVNLNSQGIACKWASQMLKDWGADILIGDKSYIKYSICNGRADCKNQQRKILITITDDTFHKKQQLKQQQIDDNSYVIRVPTIVLIDTKISSIHVAAMSGHLQTFGQKPQFPFYPNHLLEITGATGIFTSALKQIHSMDCNLSIDQILKKNCIFVQQPVIKLSLVDLMRYNGIFNSSAAENNLRNLPRGKNVLDGGAPFYSIYECNKNSYLAVGNLEPKFYQQMVRGLQLTVQERQFVRENQFNEQAWQKIRAILAKKFRQKSAYEWEKTMEAYDTCMTEVIDLRESGNYDSMIHPKLIHPKL